VIQVSKSALKGFAKQYNIDKVDGIDAVSFLSRATPQVLGFLARNRMNKIKMVLTCIMERIDISFGENITNVAPFRSKTEIVLSGADVDEIYKKVTEKCLESMAHYQRRGSSFRFKSIVRLDINTVVYRSLNVSSYIPLPAELANKKAIINMKNEDDQCFKWCVVRAFNLIGKNSERIDKKL